VLEILNFTVKLRVHHRYHHVINSISSSSTSQLTLAPVVSGTNSSSTAQVTSSSSPTDSVSLSPAAQAAALEQQGMSVKAIALQMNISVQQVDSYLGINSGSGGAGGGASSAASIASKVKVNPPASGPTS